MTVPTSAMSAAEVPHRIEGLTDAENDTLRQVLDVWRQKRPRNLRRSVYYDGKAPLRDLGISLPPQLRTLRAVLGWPEKSVRALSRRNIFDGFVTAGAEQDPFELSGLLKANSFDLELPQAITSAYKHSCSFLTVARGDTTAGDPPVVVMARSAEWSAALWDKRRRAVKAAVTISDADDSGPTALDLWLPGEVISCRKSAANRWSVTRQKHRLGSTLVQPLTYDPQLDRPFGRSRITRAVMDITDRAIRTILRTEVSAEFYASPQRWVMGAEEESFESMDRWQAVMGRFFGLSRDAEGNLPEVGQFPQMTMDPHLAMLRSLAAQFSGETGIPVSALGIIHDNPSSAEAIYAAWEDLIIEALYSNRILGAAVERTAQTAVMLRDGTTEPTDELRLLEARWRNPALPSPVSASDALVKQAAVFPWLSETEVALEMVGYSSSDITRLLADKRRAQGASVLDRALAAASDGDEG